jgi:hypothetical protein
MGLGFSRSQKSYLSRPGRTIARKQLWSGLGCAAIPRTALPSDRLKQATSKAGAPGVSQIGAPGGRSHQHPFNRLRHTLGIPIIALSLPLFLAAYHS